MLNKTVFCAAEPDVSTEELSKPLLSPYESVITEPQFTAKLQAKMEYENSHAAFSYHSCVSEIFQNYS